MPVISRAVGTVSTNISVFIPNAAVSTGAGLANIVASTVTLGWYRSDMSAVSSWTLTSGTLGTWTNSTFTQANSTAALGWYQVSLPHGLFVGGHYAAAHLSGPSGMAPVPLIFELTRDDNQQYVSSKVYSSTSIVAGVTAPGSVSTMTIPVGVSSIATPVAASSLSMPVTVSSGVVRVSSSAIPFGVSSATIPFGVSTVATPVTVSSGVVSVSSATIPFGVSSVATPVTVSSGVVSVSSVTIPVGVSSIATPVTVSTVSDKTGYTLSIAGLANFFNTDSGTVYASSVAGSVVKEIADNAGGSALTAEAIADAVWDEAQAGHVSTGSFGEVASEVADILVDTAEIGVAGAGLTAVGNVTGSVGSVTGAVGSVAAGGLPAIADAVWDEVLTGATHNVVNSSGRRLRGVAAALGGTINDAGATTTSFITTITGYNNNHFNDQLINFIDGAASGEVGVIVDYDGATGTFTLEEPLTAAPGNGSAFEIIATHVHPKSQIAAAIWDKVQADHVAAGSFGLVASEIADILVDTGTSGVLVAFPVTVSSGVVRVSSSAIPFGVSSISHPVTVSSGVVQVSSISIPVGVSSIATPVTVSTVSDKAGYSVSTMTASVNEAVADALLNRNVSSGANGGRPVKEALYVLRNKVDAGAGIVYLTDDTASSWAFSVSTQASDPIVSITPN